MARPKKPFPDYPRKPHASGAARIRVTGKDIYLGPFGSQESRDAYERLRAQHYLSRNLPVPVSVPQPTQSLSVGDVVASYLEWARLHYQHAGQPTKHYRRLLQAGELLVEYHGLPVASFTPAVFDGWLQSLCGERRCGYCGGTGKYHRRPCKRCRGTGRGNQAVGTSPMGYRWQDTWWTGSAAGSGPATRRHLAHQRGSGRSIPGFSSAAPGMPRGKPD